ncbi:multifunctional CCA addition/repair protein [Vibrio sp. CAIM 722]|uniref:Multifunctional CCA protein n=1 Tax=Vibrio eleionomae TaxID=2653505 RepID=A0A7X4LIF7_9VIBR|nr:multifunctional CCA addition/repair protein [Vibrio eleionomae]
MQVYLVGGAVRDQLLNIPVHDNDWVVVGSTPEDMLNAGYQSVGKDFPVFLHPKTKEEYALARTEKKTSVGYTGFDCYFAKDVTIEDDLMRRDLTINAIAQDPQGNLIDPYHGADDIKNRKLRHVSTAFTEDPLRVLRVARFAAKLHHLGFTVADETLNLMRHIAQSGELNHLTPERVWQEWHKSLTTPTPHKFLEILQNCGALEVVLPELAVLFGVPQPEKWHPEIDTGIHTLMVAEQAAQLTPSPIVRFAAQVHDLGKGVTPKEEWPSHKLHCHTGVKIVKALCERVRVPNEFRDLAVDVCEQHTNIHNALQLKPATLVKIFNKLKLWRQPQRLEQLLLCCAADHKGRLGFEQLDYAVAEYVTEAFNVAAQINAQDVIKDGFNGKEISEEQNRRRVRAVAQFKQEYLE